MKKVKALVAFSNGVIAMEQYEVRELPTDMANDLIAAGICVEISGGGSGGSGLPTPTADDIGKVATVIGTPTKGEVIVPEQVVYVSKTAIAFEDADASLFVDGTVVIVSISFEDNSVERTATVKSGTVAVQDWDSRTIVIEKSGNDITYKHNAGNIAYERTVSVNVQQKIPSWGMTFGSVHAVVSGDGKEPTEFTVDSVDKTVAEIMASIENGQIPCAVVTVNGHLFILPMTTFANGDVHFYAESMGMGEYKELEILNSGETDEAYYSEGILDTGE